MIDTELFIILEFPFNRLQYNRWAFFIGLDSHYPNDPDKTLILLEEMCEMDNVTGLPNPEYEEDADKWFEIIQELRVEFDIVFYLLNPYLDLRYHPTDVFPINNKKIKIMLTLESSPYDQNCGG
jgi:hypothetical protein